MMPKKTGSTISQMLTRMNLLFGGIALISACLSFVVYDQLSVRTALVSSLSAQCEIVGANSISAITFNDAEAAGKTLAALRNLSGIKSAWIVTPDQRVFAEFSRDNQESLVSSPALGLGVVEAHWFGSDELILARHITWEKKTIGTVYIRSDLDVLNRRLKQYLLITFMVLALSLLGAVVVSAGSRRSIADPITELANTAQQVSRGQDYSLRAEVSGGPSELRVLVGSFNQMLVEIQRRDNALQTAHGELEKRVQQRTQQLVAAEADLKEKNLELERASQAKDNFLASMSHELRTPLNAIIGFTGLLLMGLPGPLNEEQEKQLRTVQRGAKHLLSLINDILDVAKIQAGKVQFAIEGVDCNLVVQDVISALRPAAVSKGLDFQVVTPDGALVVRTDRRAIAQILLNLVNNAIKFTESGSVSLRVVGSPAGSSGPITFEVSDTGRGMDPTELAKLFQPFTQVGERMAEGTGLGLHLSQRLAVLLGGSIAVKSESGKGSTFTLTLTSHKDEGAAYGTANLSH
jgi:signal transduction histidine kinase